MLGGNFSGLDNSILPTVAYMSQAFIKMEDGSHLLCMSLLICHEATQKIATLTLVTHDNSCYCAFGPHPIVAIKNTMKVSPYVCAQCWQYLIVRFNRFRIPRNEAFRKAKNNQTRPRWIGICMPLLVVGANYISPWYLQLGIGEDT